MDGKKQSSNANSGFAPGIPGNITDKVTEAGADGENAAAGGSREHPADLQPGTE
ncbi:hypothetical protein ACIBCM_09200 [Streptomyces sp. NPDC051018]|uniref:hypothetical protein n=1 Tax=Streptomyces sp. NPDC051018 TaxID=3365639 RepID=UPI0037A8FDD5